MANVYGVIKRPLVTEKGVAKKEADRTLCFEVSADANKTEIRHAVEAAFKVKVAEVRTSVTSGKLRRRGRFSGFRRRSLCSRPELSSDASCRGWGLIGQPPACQGKGWPLH